MKKQSLFMLGLLVISTVFSLGCMNREPAPVCPVPTELKQTDPGLTDFDGVDILVVVDNSNSMEQEQAILATAFFPLVNTLIHPLPGDAYQGTENIRIAITTSDMGVSYNWTSYDKSFDQYDKKCIGLGNNGGFISEYISGNNEVEIEPGVIPCGANAYQCPPDWVCANIGDDQIGRCEPAAGDDNMVSCPRSPEERNMDFVDRDWDDKALAVACLANVGTTGCNFEQQLSAAAAGLKNTLNNDGTRSTFLRERKVTTIIIVSDEEDCSLKDDRWHSVPELGTAETNLACGKHTDYLLGVRDLKDSYEDSVRKIVGTTKGLVFAAIVGVPPNNSRCEGIGENLDECKDVKPGVNGTQTMEDPEIVEREVGTAKSIQNYYEFACQRWADGTSEENGDDAVTSAYPGMRFVNMAQEFGENGYVYSICHEDWSPAMNAIAGLIAENLGGSCFEKRLNWDPDSETAGCNVVFEYRADRSESAPECPSSGKWIDKGELTVDGDEWVRKCSVEKIPTAITCSNFTEEQKASIGEKFGWYYCENPGENNSVACNDGLDNDRDGKIDFDDSDCDVCKEGDNANCPADCPYKVSLTETALAEASLADDANVVCLQQYRFEDPNCKESTRDACNDGEDNDGNGPFDCWSYAKGDTIPDDQNPKKGARNADPDCCPMTVSDGGVCQFVDFRGNPVSDMAKAAYIDTCDVGTAPRDIPDACCEAAKARLCRLPDDLRDICDGRESGK
jgi:hypothetical protein